jgi:hypothetical protein
MDLKLIKQKLGALQSRGGSKSKSAEFVWKAAIGKHQVRVVPSKFDKENPFKELFFHYGFGNRTMLALTNFGEKDPIVEFAEKLMAQKPYVEENWKFGVKMMPKIQIFVPVIVRGEEEAGVKLWQFGKEVYMEMCKLAEDEEIGDFTDVMSGTDLIVETVGPDQSGRAFNKTTVRPKRTSSVLSEDPKEIEKWLKEQPEPTVIFDKPTYDQLKTALTEYMNPASDEPDQAPVGTKVSEKQDDDDLPWDKDGKDKKEDKYSLEVKGDKKKKNIDEEITKLFDQK